MVSVSGISLLQLSQTPLKQPSFKGKQRYLIDSPGHAAGGSLARIPLFFFFAKNWPAGRARMESNLTTDL